jgi:hypothetical protein
MRNCDNCGKEIPLGADHVRVRVSGFAFKGADFCKPECFEEYYSTRRYKLLENSELLKGRR